MKTGFRLVDGHGFAYQLNDQLAGQLAGLVEQANEVKTLDVALLTMVPMDANPLIGVGVGLLQHRIVHDEHGKLFGRPPGFGLPNQGLSRPPDLGRAVDALTQPARDVVVAQRPVQQPR